MTETPTRSYAEGPPSSGQQTGQQITPPPADTVSPPPWTPPPDQQLPDERAFAPEDRAALLKYTLAGLRPAEIASNYPDLWQRTGYAGFEAMPRDVLFERLRAAEAQGGAAPGGTPTGPPPPPDSALAQPFDINALTAEGQQQALAIRDDPKLDAGIKASRLQNLMKTAHR